MYIPFNFRHFFKWSNFKCCSRSSQKLDVVIFIRSVFRASIFWWGLEHLKQRVFKVEK